MKYLFQYEHLKNCKVAKLSVSSLQAWIIPNFEKVCVKSGMEFAKLEKSPLISNWDYNNMATNWSSKRLFVIWSSPPFQMTCV